MNEHRGRHIKVSIFWSLLAGMVFGVIKAIYFIFEQKYDAFELNKVGVYLIQYQVEHAVFVALIVSIVFTLIWFRFPKIEGLLVAGFVVLGVMLPISYFINKQFLPGIREKPSIVGNIILAIITIGVFLFVYFRVTRKVKLLYKLYSPHLLVVLFLLFASVEVYYYSRPLYQRLASSPTQMGTDFLNLFKSPFDDLSEKFSSDGVDSKLLVRDELLLLLSKKTESVNREVLQRMHDLKLEPDVIITRADAILRREFTLWDITRKIDKKINWYVNPTRETIWLYALDECEWMWNLAAAYVLTNDEKYARDYARIMNDWLEQVSLNKWKDESDPVWRLIGAGIRMSYSWVDAFYVFLPSKNVSNEVKIKILAAIYDHAQFLSYFRSPDRNHIIAESFGLLKVGVMFPEFKIAQQWVELAKNRLEKEMRRNVYPDGGYTEGSTFYHRYALLLFQEILDYAEKHGVTFSEEFTNKIEKMFEFLLYTSRPDGRMPQINDGFIGYQLRGSFKRHEQQFGREDFEYFGSDGKAGNPPQLTSKGFPYTGFYVMRSDWSDNANYCIFDGGLFGSAHGHEDKLSFEIFAKGKSFIVEAGTYTYEYNKWHRFFESSFAHNTVVVDNKSQLRQPYSDKWVTEPHKKLPNCWISNEHFDYIESTYKEGYGNYKENVDNSVQHTRRLLFIKPDYWILWDIISGNKEHKLEQLFHFMPMPIEINKETRAILTQNSDNTNLLLFPLFPENLSVRKVMGAEEPIQGWVSPEYGKIEPAPTIIYNKTVAIPTAFLDVIMPLSKGVTGYNIRVSPLQLSINRKVLSTTKAIALKIVNKNWIDYIMLSPNLQGNKSFENMETKKQIYYWRTDKGGHRLKEFGFNEIDTCKESDFN